MERARWLAGHGVPCAPRVASEIDVFSIFAADERFVPDGAAAGATAFCTGEGEARACVVLADSFDP